MKIDTKEKILQAASEIILIKGFNLTGIQEILNAAQVPKGSFYYYFKNKEDLGIQLIDYFGKKSAEVLMENLNDFKNSPLKSMQNMFHELFDTFVKNGYVGGCPIGNLSQEMGDISEQFRNKLKGSFMGLRNMFINILEAAREMNELPSELDLYETADFIISSFEGTLLQIKVIRNTDPIKAFDKMIFNVILKK